MYPDKSSEFPEFLKQLVDSSSEIDALPLNWLRYVAPKTAPLTSEQLFNKLVGRVLTERNKSVQQLTELLKLLVKICKENRELSTNIQDFIGTLSTYKINNASVTDLKSELEKNHLPAWDNLLRVVLQPVEIFFGFSNQLAYEYCSKILELYGCHYGDDFDIRTFQPGKAKFDGSRHERHSEVRARYPHNTILEIKWRSIYKGNTLIRKSWVTVCFSL